MKKWIYKHIPTDPMYPNADTIKFNTAGQQGWELIGFENGAAWFKKEEEYSGK